MKIDHHAYIVLMYNIKFQTSIVLRKSNTMEGRNDDGGDDDGGLACPQWALLRLRSAADVFYMKKIYFVVQTYMMAHF